MNLMKVCGIEYTMTRDTMISQQDPFWELSYHLHPDIILLMIDVIEDWVVHEQPDITLMEACFLTNTIGVT